MAVLYEWEYSLDETLGLLESNTPSEDIWKKFEDLPDFDCDLDGIYELESLFGSDFTPSLCGSNEIRRHDCMWAGTCVSDDHKRTLQAASKSAPGPSASPTLGPQVLPVTVSSPAPPVSAPMSPQVTPAPVQLLTSPQSSPKKPTPEPKAQVKRTGVIVQKSIGRSILLSSRANSTVGSSAAPTSSPRTVRTAEVSRPETPQSLSESEEEEAKRDDEPDYRGVAVSEVTGQVRRTTTVVTAPSVPAATTTPANVQFDHNYDVKAGNVRTDDLGIQTPSDSDEEIDVVSLVSSRNQTTLPTNPSRAMRYELQQTVEHAITNNKLLSASRAVSRRLKASGPGRKPKRKRVSSDDEDDYTYGTRVPKSGGNKRARYQHHYHYHHHQRRSPKKSRHSTDSETDTSERRSLHNNMERMRRIDLRNAFDDLRSLLPSLEGKHRAPKVTILKDATVFLHELALQDRTLQSQVASLRKEQEKLRTNLSHLRRSLAAKR